MNISHGCWSDDEYNQMVEYASTELWRYLQNNSVLENKENEFLKISNLTKENLLFLTKVHLIISDKVHYFLKETAPAILNRLAKTSSNETKTARGKVQGKILWAKTFKARLSYGGDPSIFVCSQRSRIFDLAENRVFLYLLTEFLSMSQSILKIQKIDDEKINIDVLKVSKWADRVKFCISQCKKLLSYPILREVNLIHKLNEKLIFDTRKARGSVYTQLADVAELFWKSINKPVDFLHEKLASQMLRPLNPDMLYEIAVVFKTIEVMRANGWTEEKAGIIGYGSKVVSHLKKNDEKIKVYYQTLPNIFARSSSYKPLMDFYQVDVGYRRPDIILEWSRNNINYYWIIEVKRTANRKYLSDGVYKLYGYLKDFQGINNNSSLRGILVCWDGIFYDEFKGKQEAYVTNWLGLPILLGKIENEE